MYAVGQACRVGYVKLNGRKVWESSVCSSEIDAHRGINILEIEPLACTLSLTRNFDTFFSYTSDNLTKYLQQMSSDTVVVGLTGSYYSLKHFTNDGRTNLSKTFGVDVANVDIVTGSFAFVGQKGQLPKTVLDTAIDRQESNRSPAHVNVAIAGTRTAVRLSLIHI